MFNINKKYITRRYGEFDYSKIPIVNSTKRLELPVKYTINNNFLDVRTVNFHKDEPVRRMIPQIDLVEEERYRKFGAKVDVNSSSLYNTFNKRTYKLPVFDSEGNMKMIPGPAPQNPMTTNYNFNEVLKNPFLLNYRITQILSESRQHHAVPDDPNFALNAINININDLKDEIKLIITNILISVIEGNELTKKLMESVIKLMKVEGISKDAKMIKKAVESHETIVTSSRQLLEADISLTVPLYEFLITEFGFNAATSFREYIHTLPFSGADEEVNLTEILINFLSGITKPLGITNTNVTEEKMWNDDDFTKKVTEGIPSDPYGLNELIPLNSDSVSPEEIKPYIKIIGDHVLKKGILNEKGANILKRRYNKLKSSNATKFIKINLNKLITIASGISMEIDQKEQHSIEGDSDEGSTDYDEKKNGYDDEDTDSESEPGVIAISGSPDKGLLNTMTEKYGLPKMNVGDKINSEYMVNSLKGKVTKMKNFIKKELMNEKNEGSGTFTLNRATTLYNLHHGSGQIVIISENNFVYQAL